MYNTTDSDSSRWFIYFVTVTMGIAFSGILFWIAWSNVLDENERDFSLQSISLRGSITRNARTAHDTVNNLESFAIANKGATEEQFILFVSALLKQHPFLGGAVYYSQDAEHFQLIRTEDESQFEKRKDIYTPAHFRDILKTLETTDFVISSVAEGGEKNRKYWLYKKITNLDSQKNEGGEGLVCVLVDTSKLLGANVPESKLAITMFNNFAGLSNRQLLYGSVAMDKDTAWSVAQLNQEGVIQFPMYSIRLAINQGVHWDDIEMSGVLIALIIGFGVTLLLVALVQAKDQQARELKERNIVIENKVEEQTKELALARDEALDASRIKSEFLASMSHEIRTPLNAIIGMSELLSETEQSQEQKKYIDVFRRAGDTLLALVNDILDLSKIEAHQMVLEEINFDIVENIEETVEIYALKGAEKSIELLAQVDTDIPSIRNGDPSRLRQIVLNLISNALKFTEKGEIVVKVSRDRESGDPDYLHFSVSDTGIGIPKQKLEAIFASFTQVDSSTTRKYGGTGLGLTISKSLTEMMAGKIWVDSEEGEGSTFHFVVKINVAEDQNLAPKAVLDIKDKRILIVDDNTTNRLIINKQLTAGGAIVQEAGSGRAALEVINQLQGKEIFDVILVDCRMPEMDGFELISEMKIKGIDLNTILMLSSADLSDNVSKARDLGIARYLVKPIKRAELIQQLGQTVYGTGIEDKPQTEPAVEEAHNGKLKILLVEDNPDNRLLIKAYLKKLPYELVEAENGEIAVEKFTQSDYNLVLMDVQMPVMDGHQATRAIRKWETEMAKTPTPIISLTAHAIKEEIDKCIAAGCDTHLSKPVKKATLIDTIQRYTS